MFTVDRYDPNKASEKRGATSPSGKRRKRSRNSSQDRQTGPEQRSAANNPGEKKAPPKSLPVIAPDATENDRASSELHKKLPARTAEEAFDDLDMIEEFVDGEGTATKEQDESINDVGQASQKEIETAIRISKLPIEEAAAVWKLAPFLVENLKHDGFEHFFPIQALSIPDVVSSERYAHIQAQDICITAPTGSGKTLSYALPLINSLASRQVRRLRALIVLPSRDLATQVHQVLENYVKGSDLKVGLAIGQSDFTAEQIALTLDTQSDDPDMLRHCLSFDPGNLELALRLGSLPTGLRCTSTLSRVAKSWSNVDILVSTPGRLVDHLDKTPGFSLQHLRFLVVDEADRLMSQSYHGWIDRVIQSANSASMAAWKQIVGNNNRLPTWELSPDKCSFEIDPITWRRGGVSGDVSAFNVNDSYFAPATAACRPVQLRKFLVSATLTRDPQKLAALRLVNPKHFDVHQLTESAGTTSSHRYSMPDELQEYTVECTAEQKPLVLLALLLEHVQTLPKDNGDKELATVFTASLDSTHRLARLLQLLWVSGGFGSASAVAEFSSALNQKERSALVQRCNDPEDNLSVIVCSDGMSRGMDIESLGRVINYDVASLAKTYVHRCGRTARAGKAGTAISLLKGGQVGQFAKMRQLIHAPDKVSAMKVKKGLVRDVVSKYRQCVSALRDVLEAEEHGELRHTEVFSEEFIPNNND